MSTHSLPITLLGIILLSFGSTRAAARTDRSALLQDVAAQFSALTGTSVVLQEEFQAPAVPKGAPVQSDEGTVKALGSGVILEGTPPPGIAAALKAAMARVGPLPSGVELTVRSRHDAGNTTQILISVDGVRLYSQPLTRAEIDLADLRRSLWKPGTWSVPTPSSDLSKRFEAALTLAREGAVAARARRGR